MLQQVDSYINKTYGDRVPYVVSLPKDYDAKKKYPLIVFATGDGSKSGAGEAKWRSEGLNGAIQNGLEIPFIVFCPITMYSGYDVVGPNNDSRPGEFLNEAADVAISKFSVDTNKVYVTGLSMGGVSVYYAMAFFPNKFAGGICIASWPCELEYATKIKGLIWDIKLDGDTTAGFPSGAINFINACKNSKKAQYTFMKGAGHGGWYEVYSNSWIGKQLSTDYPSTAPTSNIYTELLKYSLDGTVVTPPVVEPPVTNPPVINPPVTSTNISNMTIKDSTGKVLLGKIEAENYTATNKKGTFTENTTDENGGKNVGWSNVNDYLDYAINIPVDGVYQIDLRVATIKDAQIKVSSGTSSNVVSALNSNGWQNWKTISTQLKLVAGPQTLRITAMTDGFNINWLNVSLYSLTINGYLVTE